VVMDTGSQSLRSLVLKLRERLSQMPHDALPRPGHGAGAA
jgi:hypothetical protein